MAYSSGTATNYIDLLDKLEAFLTTDTNLVAAGQAWTTLRYGVGTAPLAFPLTRINFGTAAGFDIPDASFPSTNFKLRVVGTLTVPTTGDYKIGINCDDCGEVLIDGDLAVGWYASHLSSASFDHNQLIHLTAGTHQIEVRLVQTTGAYSMSVGWQKPGDGSISVIPATNLSNLLYQWSSYSGYVPTNTPEMGNLWTQRELIMKAPGMSGVEEIYVGIQPFANISSDFYNWRLNGFVGYVPGNDYSAQPYKSDDVFSYLWNSAIPYWFVANGQRVIVVAKISNTYHTIYLGKYLTYCLPSQFPYPLLISGSGEASNYRWSSANYSVGNIGNPSTGARMFYIDNVWHRVCNRIESSGTYYWDDASINVWPTQRLPDTSPILASLSWPDNGYTLLPLIFNWANPGNVLGEADGVFWVSGHQNAAENIITISGENYLVVPSVYRTNSGEYIAVRLS